MATPNTLPIFVKTPALGSVLISAANASRTGTGTILQVIAGAVNGTRINKIFIKAQGNTTAGMVRLFLKTNLGDYHLWKEIKVTAITASAIVQTFNFDILLPGENALVLPTGWYLYASTEKAEIFIVQAHGGDY
jgi:hypothetical protein